MSRPVTLFTGQWADLPLTELAEKAAAWGYDGLELACWGDHFDVVRAADDPSYCVAQREMLQSHGLDVWAISNHLVGQAVCDIIDARHESILPAHVWGDGDPEAVRQRAADEMKLTARAAANLGVDVVNGFTGSSIWHLLYSFPPVSEAMIEAGFQDFADRWGPILDVFDEEGVRFALEVHPTEIAFDVVTAERALDAVGRREAFGFNYDPSHLAYQGVDLVDFVPPFRRADLPRAHEGRVVVRHTDAGRRLRRPLAVRARRPFLGLPLTRPRACAVRRGHARLTPDRLPWPAFGGVGGLGNGSRARRGRGV